MQALEKLADSPRFTADDLCRAYEEWKCAEHNHRREFEARREKVVKLYSGTFYGDAKEIGTSGSSTGVSRTYRWGPCFEEFSRFHYDVCFGDIDHDHIFYLSLSQGMGGYSESRPDTFHGKSRIFIGAPRLSRDRDLILRAINRTGKTPIVWVSATQADITVKRGSNILLDLADAGAVLHSTGEMCPDSLKSYCVASGIEFRDTMRVWNGGCAFFTCKHGGLHWIDIAAKTSVKGGELISSDLWNCAQLFWDYETGDKVDIVDNGECVCGLRSVKNLWSERWSAVTTSEGRTLGYAGLRRGLVCAMADNGINAELLGCSFGIGDTMIVVHYEGEFEAGRRVEQSFSRHIGEATRSVIMVNGLRYGAFKPKRVYAASDKELIEYIRPDKMPIYL